MTKTAVVSVSNLIKEGDLKLSEYKDIETSICRVSYLVYVNIFT